jgi:hypothetical protein
MDILEQFFIQKYNHENKLIQEQIPVESNPLFTLLYNTQLRHATAWTGFWFHSDASVM